MEGLNLTDNNNDGTSSFTRNGQKSENSINFDRHTLTRLPKRSKNNLLPLATKNASIEMSKSSEERRPVRQRFISQDTTESQTKNDSETGLINKSKDNNNRKIDLQRRGSGDTITGSNSKIKPTEVQDRRNTTKSYKSLSSLKSFETQTSTMLVSQKNGSMNDLLDEGRDNNQLMKNSAKNSKQSYCDRIRVFDRKYLETIACEMRVNEFVEVSSFTGESVCSLFRKAGYLGYLNKCNMSFPLYEDLLKVRGMSD